MSADYEESDAELKALRNELLNGLDVSGHIFCANIIPAQI